MTDQEPCPVCMGLKPHVDGYRDCECIGLQTYGLSCYPGEFKNVPIHPSDLQRAQFYKREDVEKRIAELEAQLVKVKFLETQLEKINQGFGRLAPKGTWLCTIMERIWRAKDVEEAKSIGDAYAPKISENGLWVGDRLLKGLLRKMADSLRNLQCHHPEPGNAYKCAHSDHPTGIAWGGYCERHAPLREYDEEFRQDIEID